MYPLVSYQLIDRQDTLFAIIITRNYNLNHYVSSIYSDLWLLASGYLSANLGRSYRALIGIIVNYKHNNILIW